MCRSTFMVRQLCEKLLAKGKDLFWTFIDLEKANDRVDRDALWQVSRLYGVSGKLLKPVQSSYVDSKACIRIGKEISGCFSVNVGVRQGCVTVVVQFVYGWVGEGNVGKNTLKRSTVGD